MNRDYKTKTLFIFFFLTTSFYSYSNASLKKNQNTCKATISLMITMFRDMYDKKNNPNACSYEKFQEYFSELEKNHCDLQEARNIIIENLLFDIDKTTPGKPISEEKIKKNRICAQIASRFFSLKGIEDYEEDEEEEEERRQASIREEDIRYVVSIGMPYG